LLLFILISWNLIFFANTKFYFGIIEFSVLLCNVQNLKYNRTLETQILMLVRAVNKFFLISFPRQGWLLFVWKELFFFNFLFYYTMCKIWTYNLCLMQSSGTLKYAWRLVFIMKYSRMGRKCRHLETDVLLI
jgi:hypothetical protein